MKREQEMIKEQQLREQQREQELMEKQRKEQEQREQEAREQQRREQERQQQQLLEQQQREAEAREQQLREQQMREQQMREEQQRKEQQMREQQMREQQMREQQMQQQQMQQQQMQQQQFQQQQTSMSRTTTQTSNFSQQQNLQQSNLSMQVKSGGFMHGQQGGQQQVEDYTSSLKPTSEGELIRTQGDLHFSQSSVQSQQMEQVQLRSTGGAKDIKDNIRQSGVFVGIAGDLNALVADGNEKHSVQDIVKHFPKVKPGAIPDQMMPQHYQMQHAPPSLTELQEQAKERQFSYQKRDQVDAGSELSHAEQKAAEEKAKLFERRTSLKEYLLMDGEKSQKGNQIIDPSNILQGAKASRWQSDSPFESRFSLRGMSASPTMQMRPNRPIAPKPFVKFNTDNGNTRPPMVTGRQPEQHHPKHLQKMTRPDSTPISRPHTQTEHQITKQSIQTQEQRTVSEQQQVMYTQNSHQNQNVEKELNDANLSRLLEEEQLELQRQQQLKDEYEALKKIKELEIQEENLRRQQHQEQQLREQQMRELQKKEQERLEQQMREQQMKEQQMREQQMKEQQMREQQQQEKM